MSRKIPILIHIDVEPGCLFIDPGKPLPWDAYERTYGYFTALRSQLTESRGAPAHFSWIFRTDPQIALTYGAATWPITQYGQSVKVCVGHGDDIGLHVPAYRWSPEHGNWVVDFGNSEWVEHYVRTAIEA